MPFGQPDEVLIHNLKSLQQHLCQYGNPSRCDCKFGASLKGEQSGCPEIGQAIMIISGQREQVTITKELFEKSAKNAMARIKHEVEKFYQAEPTLYPREYKADWHEYDCGIAGGWPHRASDHEPTKDKS